MFGWGVAVGGALGVGREELKGRRSRQGGGGMGRRKLVAKQGGVKFGGGGTPGGKTGAGMGGSTVWESGGDAKPNTQMLNRAVLHCTNTYTIDHSAQWCSILSFYVTGIWALYSALVSDKQEDRRRYSRARSKAGSMCGDTRVRGSANGN
jgi:hypothetical protein